MKLTREEIEQLGIDPNAEVLDAIKRLTQAINEKGDDKIAVLEAVRRYSQTVDLLVKKIMTISTKPTNVEMDFTDVTQAVEASSTSVKEMIQELIDTLNTEREYIITRDSNGDISKVISKKIK